MTHRTTVEQREIGLRLRRRRKSRGVTQDDVAREYGCAQMAVSLWERGHHVPTGEKLAEVEKSIDRAAAKKIAIIEARDKAEAQALAQFAAAQ